MKSKRRSIASHNNLKARWERLAFLEKRYEDEQKLNEEVGGLPTEAEAFSALREIKKITRLSYDFQFFNGSHLTFKVEE